LAWNVRLAAGAEKTLLKLDVICEQIVVVRIGHRSDVYRN
jgi:hypothetical protein